jgi:hypothetical protein
MSCVHPQEQRHLQSSQEGCNTSHSSMIIQQHFPLGMQNPQLLIPLLQHPSINQDQQVVAALQQTSQQLQAAVAELLAGQLPVALHIHHLQQAQAFVEWVSKHAGMVKALQLQLPTASSKSGSRHWVAGTATALGDALQHAAAITPSQLQSFALKGATAHLGILQQLLAAHLTELHAQVDFRSSAHLQALGALTSLRHLELINTEAAATATQEAPDELLAPLAAGLQQLTQLQISTVTPAQLQLLPPSCSSCTSQLTCAGARSCCCSLQDGCSRMLAL